MGFVSPLRHEHMFDSVVSARRLTPSAWVVWSALVSTTGVFVGCVAILDDVRRPAGVLVDRRGSGIDSEWA